ncbi:high chlorophyll fluorescent 107 isoform X2 [Wolffia australiana]
MQIYSSPQQLGRLFTPCSSPSGVRSLSRCVLRGGIAVHGQILHPRSARDVSIAFSSGSTLAQEEIGRKNASDPEEEAEENLLLVRRPAKDLVREKADEEEEEESVASSSASGIETGLNEFAKKMPIFEPLERVVGGPEERPLPVNLELWLYRAKVLTRNFQFDDAERVLGKCSFFWPEDGRAYVALGKLFSKQSKLLEARAVYEKGSQATQGENPYIWQCWAVLEKKLGNVRRARELFDAATVADKKHVAAWHGWAVLEIDEGNIKKARSLLGKGLRYCGANEYIYQTLALLEAKSNRYDQARYFFRQATLCNSRSCASWLAWAQLEMQVENNRTARKLFEKAVQASPKNRFAWQVWGLFEYKYGDIEKGRKLLKIGHALNPRDPVILQSLALLEYKHSSANLARVLFRRASEIDPKHQPVWIAWGWMEWKEGNTSTARELYQRALSINDTTESAARCLQAWGVLEQRLGNLTAARRLFRSSLNINSQSYVTWMTWASLEEDQGNPIRAEEIRNLYLQQRTEVVDDASWVMGFSDIINPAVDSIRRLLKFDEDPAARVQSAARNIKYLEKASVDQLVNQSSSSGTGDGGGGIAVNENGGKDFDLDAFIKDRFSLQESDLDAIMENSRPGASLQPSRRRVWRLERG